MEISDYLKEEVTGTYSDYTDEQVKHKFLHVVSYPKFNVMYFALRLCLCSNFQYICTYTCSGNKDAKPENVQQVQLSDIKKKYRARRERIHPRVY